MTKKEKTIALIRQLKDELWNVSQHGFERTTHDEVYDLISEAEALIRELEK